MRAVVHALIGLLAVLLWAQPAEAILEPRLVTYAHLHNTPVYDLPTSDTAPERAPPPNHSQLGVSGGQRAVDHWLHGTLARHIVSTTVVLYAYDRTARPAQAASAGTVAEVVPATLGDLWSPERSRVAAKTADDWPILSGIVRDASKGKGNFGLGSGSASQATRAGESWVGEGYRVASDGKTLVSRDGLRTFRPPTWKPNEGKFQANFEYWIGERTGKPFGNGHLDIMDMGP